MKDYLIDTHAHVDMLEEHIAETLKKMDANKVKKVINPACDLKSFDRILALSKKHNNIYAMLGIYPSEAKTYSEDVEEIIVNNAQNIVAIGEIGLDYYWDKSFKELQCEVFAKQIILANKLNLPIVVHDREAHKDCFDILKENNKNCIKII